MEKFYKIYFGAIAVSVLSYSVGYIRGIQEGIIWSAPVSVVQRDVNGDGIKDIVVNLNKDNSNIFIKKDNSHIFIGDTNGNYTPWEAYKSNLVNQSTDKVAQLERKVMSNAQKGLEARK